MIDAIHGLRLKNAAKYTSSILKTKNNDFIHFNIQTSEVCLYTKYDLKNDQHLNYFRLLPKDEEFMTHKLSEQQETKPEMHYENEINELRSKFLHQNE